MIVILGGGLSGSLLAYRLSQMNPQPDFLLIEAQDRLEGDHTWSFHESDLSAESMTWIRPLVAASWDQQEVRFHDFTRILHQRYHSIPSSHLNQIIQSRLRDRLLLGKAVFKIDSHCVYLENTKIEAHLIFDARGLEQQQLQNCGFQKFVGMDLELGEPHGLKHPVIMDTLCKQKEGYRFFYLLPWNSHSILVEDTRYSINSHLRIEEFKSEIRAYCDQAGWSIRKELRTEAGSLPIPLSSLKLNSKRVDLRTVCIGSRGGFFHWTTGYSFSYAVRIAELISEELKRNLNGSATDFFQALRFIRNEVKRQSLYFALLNRMLFLASEPSNRWKIFHRFYHLNEDLICRFYQGRLKFADQARILFGRPPVPIYSALKSAFNSKTHPEVYGEDSSEATQ